MAPAQLPLDIWHLIKCFVPVTDLIAHTALFNTSAHIRNELYPSDISWKSLLHGCGLSRSIYDRIGSLSDSHFTPTWRSLVRQIVQHQRRGCDAELVVGVDPGSEGVEAQVYWEPLCDWLEQRAAKFSYIRAPLSLDDIAFGSTSLEINRDLKLYSFNLHYWDAIDPQRVRRRRGPQSPEDQDQQDQQHPVSMIHHPLLANAFATTPPVTEIYLWFGQTRVINPTGVTLWDVRQALLHNRHVSHGWARSWLEEVTEGHNMGPLELERALTLDGWEQEKPGSIRLGSEAAWARFEELGWRGA